MDIDNLKLGWDVVDRRIDAIVNPRREACRQTNARDADHLRKRTLSQTKRVV
jgi:hypothetical protein